MRPPREFKKEMDYLLKTTQCAPSGTIAMLALGAQTGDSDWLLHVSQCERCSTLLRDAMEDLQREPSGDESALAESIPPPPRLRVRPKQLDWKSAVAAAMVLCAAAGLFRYLSPAVLTDELNKEYALHRTLDLRIPGAPYAAMRVERSGEAAGFASTRLKIAEALEKSPRDAVALHAQGRLALIEGHEGEAIRSLEAARAAGLNDPVDLATAYFQRGRRQASSDDRTAAFDLLSAHVRDHPNDAAAAYNLALMAAELRKADARVYFDRYLAIESSPEWKREAIEKLTAVLDAKPR